MEALQAFFQGWCAAVSSAPGDALILRGMRAGTDELRPGID
jgi:hypothetical protein